MIDEQKASRRAMLDKLEGGYVSESDEKALLESMEQQYQLEQDDLDYRLSLRQSEEAERLRKVRQLPLYADGSI